MGHPNQKQHSSPFISIYPPFPFCTPPPPSPQLTNDLLIIIIVIRQPPEAVGVASGDIASSIYMEEVHLILNSPQVILVFEGTPLFNLTYKNEFF